MTIKRKMYIAAKLKLKNHSQSPYFVKEVIKFFFYRKKFPSDNFPANESLVSYLFGN